MSNINSNQLSRSEFLKLTALSAAGVFAGTNNLFAFLDRPNTDFYHFKVG
jgi:hypothetical protein